MNNSSQLSVPIDETESIQTEIEQVVSTEENIDINTDSIGENIDVNTDENIVNTDSIGENIDVDTDENIVNTDSTGENIDANTDSIGENIDSSHNDAGTDFPPSKARKLSESDDISSKSLKVDEVKAEKNEEDTDSSNLSNPLMSQFASNCIHKLSPFWGGDGKPPAYLNELADFSYEAYEKRFENACKKRYQELLQAQAEKIEKAKADGLPMPISMHMSMPMPPRNVMPPMGGNGYMSNTNFPPGPGMGGNMNPSNQPYWGGGGAGGPPGNNGNGFGGRGYNNYPGMQQAPQGTWQ